MNPELIRSGRLYVLVEYSLRLNYVRIRPKKTDFIRRPRNPKRPRQPSEAILILGTCFCIQFPGWVYTVMREVLFLLILSGVSLHNKKCILAAESHMN